MKRFKYLTLAALVGLWACDSGTSTTTEPTPTGTISGTVTIEGTGASGVTVTLSSGTTTTTAADGTYAFSNVNAGAYTVAISGYASDATFDATTKAATITSAGQVATVNFAGSYIKTSSIVGVVSAGAGPLENVTVTLSGAASATTTTDAAGAYSFSGLRAGSYTVAISGYGSEYTFPATSQDATLGVGESKVVSFSGSYVTTASVSGRMFLDENAKDGVYTAGLEDNLSVANVTVSLELSVGNDVTTQTAADGTYSFENLPPGTYRVSLDETSSAIPGNVAFSGTSPQVVTVTAGGQATVNWPFDITQQTIHAYGYLGVDGKNPGVTPVEGWAIDLYDTEANANAGGSAGKLDTATVVTDAMGEAVFRFARSKDKDPSGTTTDQIVFARAAGANADGSPAGPYILNGERIIEIHYDAKDSIGTAPDTLDALVKQVTFAVRAMTIGGDSLDTWRVQQRTDTTGAVAVGMDTDAHGYAYFTKSTSNFPATYYLRLASTQVGAGTHAFMQTPTVGDGTAEGQYIKFVHDGTTAVGDTVYIGEEQVKYLDADIVAQVHHELDDSTGVPTYTLGDNVVGTNGISVTLWKVHPDGKKTAVSTMTPADPGLGGDGSVTFANMLTDSTYEVVAQPVNALRVVLLDTLISVTGMDGSVQADSVNPLEGGAGFSTFAFKGDQNKINGTLKAIDGSADVTKRLVKIMPDPGNIQPRVFADGSSDTTVVSDATGGFRTYANLREGKWIVMPLDSVTAAGDSIWAFDEADQQAELTLKGTGNTESTGILRAYRMDTKIQGVVVNDHDMDLNVVDNGEALAVDVNLYRTKVDADSLVGTATSDGTTGAYSFTKLRQGTYVVQRVEPASGDVIVLRKTSKGDTAIVTTDAGANKTVGSLAPNPLPRWDYLTGSVANAAGMPYFTFLWENGTVSGRVIETGDVSTPVENITVSIYQCKTAVGVGAIDFAPTPEGAVAAGPPLDPSCLTYTQAAPLTSMATDADGNYSFSGLTEGIYEIRVAPSTAGYTNDDTGPVIFKLLGSGDHEAFYNATVAASNHEVS